MEKGSKALMVKDFSIKGILGADERSSEHDVITVKNSMLESSEEAQQQQALQAMPQFDVGNADYQLPFGFVGNMMMSQIQMQQPGMQRFLCGNFMPDLGNQQLMEGSGE